MSVLIIVNCFVYKLFLNKNQNSVSLRGAKILLRNGVGHTAFSAIKASSVSDPITLLMFPPFYYM